MLGMKRREFVTLLGGAGVAHNGARANLSIAPDHYRGTRAPRWPRGYSRARFG